MSDSLSILNGRIDLDTAPVVTRRKPRGKSLKLADVVPSAPAPKPVTMLSARRPLTVGLGCGIPLLSLTLSHQGGELLQAGHWPLGVGSLVLCGVVLCLSLSHLASAIEDITHSARWQSWALAIAVDAALVIAELVRVSGNGTAVQWATMAALTAVSAALNVWGFIRHGK